MHPRVGMVGKEPVVDRMFMLSSLPELPHKLITWPSGNDTTAIILFSQYRMSTVDPCTLPQFFSFENLRDHNFSIHFHTNFHDILTRQNSGVDADRRRAQYISILYVLCTLMAPGLCNQNSLWPELILPKCVDAGSWLPWKYREKRAIEMWRAWLPSTNRIQAFAATLSKSVQPCGPKKVRCSSSWGSSAEVCAPAWRLWAKICRGLRQGSVGTSSIDHLFQFILRK